MNIFQLSNRTGVSLKTLRKIEKTGALKLDAESEFVEELRFHMGRNQTLTTAQLLTLIEEPDTIDELGAIKAKYADRARAAVASLGDVQPAPRNVTAEIAGAAAGEENAVRIVATWLRSILPAEPVPHHWITVRLLIGLNENLRPAAAAQINLAMLKIRNLPEFSANWKTVKGANGRNAINYFALPLDL